MSRAIITRICQQCGIEYEKKPKRNANEGNMFCSRLCSNVHKGAIRHMARLDMPSSSVFFKACNHCGIGFVARRNDRLSCSDECKRLHTSRLPSKKLCACCGKEFKPVYGCGGVGAAMNCCSQQCRLVIKKRSHSAQNTKREAKKRCVTVELVHTFKVFDRDRWTCKLCGCKTPKAKRGTYEDNAPELDHIIPLSKGGEHSYRNTQCACRKCNANKSATPLGQLLMFG